MKVLNFFYENHPKFELNYERKLKLYPANILLKGAKNSGKKRLILNFLSSFKSEEVLFIDLEDVRFEKESLNNLTPFLKQNTQIKILCLYNAPTNLNFQSPINTIVCTNNALLNLKGFKELFLNFCDFEEFISISKKNLPIQQLLGLFLQNGQKEHNKISPKEFSFLELEILKYLALNLGKEISINQLFLSLKTKIKTSKDSVYKSIKDLENRFIITILTHGEKKLFKIYFKDFSLRNALCIQKNFNALFENMLLCELFKCQENLFYNKFFHFYTHHHAYISSPTLDIDLIKLRAKKILPKALELGIFHIVFITLSSEESFFEQGVKFEILPFDKWALSF
ncbi:ATP-binding protein [Campylobacter vulpis]|uniref:ATP-binding protein n=1 Tax=Campylobacter vulpis TaxID=1655500 RepID=A0A2G4QYV5_9BACT|nr:ATP-binding protein [Campylobacter vulpis]MBS4240937.1 ATP-binding protein [Campylobacter vulpis]MBS4252837.1 ATP-binding protein [Campylobacter vulpis]MBS4276098.1 ATP-binding protein [Campylobacter vulpis]MBS4281823.1 ATP-binding protein [Campylobacter vulpis]MBS4307513.1 ATP-binding protein [Campylobacter vulpis]